MPVPERFLMGAVALAGIFMLVLACRSGRICSVGRVYEADENPVSYGLTFALQILIIIFCASEAAGVAPAKVFDVIGLGWINSFCRLCGQA
jgi:hypothetical protein